MQKDCWPFTIVLFGLIDRVAKFEGNFILLKENTYFMTFAAIWIQKMSNHCDGIRFSLALITQTPSIVWVEDLTKVGSVVWAHITLKDLC